MSIDPVVEEIHRFREALAARFNYDVEALVEYGRQKDAEDNRELYHSPPRKAFEYADEVNSNVEHGAVHDTSSDDSPSTY